MKYSEMKIAAKVYFNRNWNREDMLNPNEIPGHAHKTLKKKAFHASPALLSASWQVQQFAMELFGLEPAYWTLTVSSFRLF
ncbi:hypothetical protein CQW23_03087 [Capsicum baccatum]|uniref:Uncharacterized protein n=1 Tax=Capsicum baccatum TaxID=33114 RepID=A0A2G2XT96_CAPBA|nr:hypothetical protein CQW23_03087 [Capsicum baccatum]